MREIEFTLSKRSFVFWFLNYYYCFLSFVRVRLIVSVCVWGGGGFNQLMAELKLFLLIVVFQYRVLLLYRVVIY